MKEIATYNTNRFHLAVRVFSDNARRTSKRGKNISHAILCSYHVLKSSVRYQRTHAVPNEIYLLDEAFQDALTN